MESSQRAGTEKERQMVVSEFLNSDTQKIFMLIGSDLSAIDRSLRAAIDGTQNMVFRYEFWSGEHPRHFLFRWLWETVNVQTAYSKDLSSDIAPSDSQLAHKLRLLIEKDIRALEIRFLEAIRFIAGETAVGQKILLSFAPRTSLQDKSLLEFFQVLLRALPLNVKMLIGQHNDDILARQTDFCPSNRLTVTAVEGLDGIAEKYRACLESGSTAGRLLHVLATLVHPVGMELLARMTGQNEETLHHVLHSSELQDLVEPASDNAFRLKYPQALTAESFNAAKYDNPDSLYVQALDYYEGRLSREGADYIDVLNHSLSLHHVEDVQVLARHIRSVGMEKLRMGGGDICELEISRALSLLGDEQTQLKAGLLLRLGEVREARQQNREAMEALGPAIEILKNSENLVDLQFALELMGRAAFGLRDMDASKAAFDESLLAAKQLGKDALTAGLLSQIGYLHFSMKQLDDAETFYRESLELYGKIAETDQAQGQKGTAAQLSNLGHTGYARGDFEAAESFHRKALEIYKALGEIQSSANQWGYLGHTFFAKNSYEKAVQAYEHAAELEEGLGKPEKAAQRYANVGHSMYAQRKVELAKNSFQKALDKYTRLGNLEGRAAQLSNLGMVAGDEGEYESAADYFNRAAELYREMRDAIGETSQSVRLAQVYLAGGRYDEAIGQYETALNRYREIGYPAGEADVLLEVGGLLCKKNEWQKGRESFAEAGAIFAKIGHREKEGLCLLMMAHADKGAGRPDAAMADMQQAMELYRKDENALAVANVASQMGLLQFEQEHFEEAERLYLEALGVFREKGDAEGEANALSNLGTLYYALNKLSEAGEYYRDALSLVRKLNHPSGIAAMLVNFSFVSEKEGKLDDAGAQLKEARELFEHLHASDQLAIIDRRIEMIEQKAIDSLKQMREQMRAELFSTAVPKNKTTVKVGPNAPCPCGSGKKFKKCCGY
jgi:tetratricopeptide (TPR) repeat protein